MKRLWLGFAILAVLLAASIGVQFGMQRLQEPITRDLELAAQAALEEDWETASALSARAQRAWEKCHGLTAGVADHNPMDEVDMLMEEIAVFSRKQEGVHFAATCRSAAQLTQAMADAHTLTLWNFL